MKQPTKVPRADDRAADDPTDDRAGVLDVDPSDAEVAAARRALLVRRGRWFVLLALCALPFAVAYRADVTRLVERVAPKPSAACAALRAELGSALPSAYTRFTVDGVTIAIGRSGTVVDGDAWRGARHIRSVCGGMRD